MANKKTDILVNDTVIKKEKRKLMKIFDTAVKEVAAQLVNMLTNNVLADK